MSNVLIMIATYSAVKFIYAHTFVFCISSLYVFKGHGQHWVLP